MKFQRGGFAIGLVVGLLIGLALALGVALYITKAPVPFINKVPQRTAEQDNAEAERNKHWDPNAPLSGKPGARPAAPSAAASAAPLATAPTTAPTTAPATAPTTATKPGRDPAAILSGAPSTATAAEPFVYFVQVGAFTRAEDAEQQRARLAMLGYAAKVTEREQSGRTVFRVRAGPYDSRDEADGAQVRLQEAGVEARLVRVERP